MRGSPTRRKRKRVLESDLPLNRRLGKAGRDPRETIAHNLRPAAGLTRG